MPSTRPSAVLSVSDDTVLDRIFDPEAAPSLALVISPDAPVDPNISDPSLLARLNARASALVQLIEASVIANDTATTQGLLSTSTSATTLDHAISAFTTLVSEHPTYASAYLNRAQALRLKHGDHLYRNPCADRMIADLYRTIVLSTPASPTLPVSPTQARTLANAHTFRGMLLHIASKDLLLETGTAVDTSGVAHKTTEMPSLLINLTVGQVQEMASHDFQLGGRYGSTIARAMAVKTNPYAKLCGSIVQEAMRKELGNI
ncbi:hypothetical protein MMC13_006409 [Lambiella insularis]|nr:hypothetical protein [Lambiella insularis]